MGDGFDGDELSQGMLPLIPSEPSSLTLPDCGVKLVTADDRKIVIAEYSSEHHFTKKRTARLEVQQSGMHMLDYIILTFIFVEYQRKVRKDAVNDSAAYA